MSSTAQVLKNWDWDKLQEKRAKQKGFTPPPRDPEPEEPRPDNTDDRERRDFFGGGNGGNNGGNNGGGDNGVDPLLPQALKICIDNGVASTTMVQRKLSIGYPRAARIVDQMEERGYIASADGSKQRAVYITIDEFYTIFGDIYD